MDNTKLAEIKSRAEAATPGPWRHWPEAGDIEITTDGFKEPIVSKVRPRLGWGENIYVDNQEPDAEFIAHAREDIPALVAALEAAEAELTRRDTVRALHEEGDRTVLSSAIGAVVWNASNHPKPSAVLGQDIGPLRSKLVDAVLAAGFTRAAPVSLEAAHDSECEADWGIEGQESPCRCNTRSVEAAKAETTTEWGVRWISMPAPAVTDRGAPEADVRRLVQANPLISEAVTREVTEWRPVETEKGGAQNE